MAKHSAVDISVKQSREANWDPSYSWIFIYFGIMALFSRFSIKGHAARIALAWTGKRAYSIYLLQYWTLAAFTALFYTDSFFGVVMDMNEVARAAMWIFTVFCAYFLALGIASIIDTVLLAPLQKIFKKVFMRPEKRDEMPA